MSAPLVPPGWTVVETCYEDTRRATYRASREGAVGESAYIKIVRDPVSAEVEALRREFKMVKSFDSPHIIKFIALFDKPVPGLIAEDNRAPTLPSLVKSHPLSILARVEIAVGIMQSLDVLHRGGVVHLHLRPECFSVTPGTLFVIMGGLHSAVRLPAPAGLVFEGVPAYMAPEQTGRTGQNVDARSDLYAIGMVLFQLFTTKFPFPMPPTSPEWILVHLARVPPLATELSPDVPPIAAHIIELLLKKEKSERYQSAFGLLRDLTRLRDAMRECADPSGYASISFPLRQVDRSALLTAPSDLIGRDNELIALLSAFVNSKRDGLHAAFISGYSGIGKTSLVESFRRRAEQACGPRGLWYGTGKCEHKRLTPLSGMVQIIESFMDAVLSQGPVVVNSLRQRLLEELGPGAAVLVEIFPCTARVLGRQAVPETRDPATTRNVLLTALTTFFYVLAESRAVLALVDDVQWADDGTLQVLDALLADPRQHNMMVVMVYRSNEVNDNNALVGLLRKFATRGNVTRLPLSELTVDQVAQLVGTALGCAPEACTDLVTLCFERTNGNPFFVWTYLQAMFSEGLIKFDFDSHAFKWKIDELKARLSVSDNVAEVVSRRLTLLPTETAQLLTQAACIGPRFDVPLLATVSGGTEESVRSLLHVAAESGLVVAMDGSRQCAQYRFLHDKIREGALLSHPELRGRTHLAVAQRLATQAADEAWSVFATADHYNLAVGEPGLEVPDGLLMEIARINLSATRAAKRAVSLDSAHAYARAALAAARRHAPDDALWREDYATLYAIHTELIEFNILDDAHIEAALQHTKSVVDAAILINVKCRGYNTIGNFEQSVRWCRRGLDTLGDPIPETSEAIDAQNAALMAEITTLLETIPISKIIDLPLTGDGDRIRAKAKIYGSLLQIGYITGSNLHTLACARAVREALVSGCYGELGYPISHFGSALSRIQRYRDAYEMCELSMRIEERNGTPVGVGDINIAALSTFIGLGRPWADVTMRLENTITACREFGSFQRAAFGFVMAIRQRVIAGHNLASWIASTFVREMVALVRALRAESALTSVKAVLRSCYEVQYGEEWLQALKVDYVELAASFIEDSPTAFVDSLRDQWGQSWYVAQHALFLLAVGRLAEAHDWAKRGRTIQTMAAGQSKDNLCLFVAGAALGQMLEVERKGAEKQAERLTQLTAYVDELRLLRDSCPENFGYMFDYVNALRLRATGAAFDEMVRAFDSSLQAAMAVQNWYAVMFAHEGLARLWSQFPAHISAKYCMDHQASAAAARNRWGCIDPTSYSTSTSFAPDSSGGSLSSGTGAEALERGTPSPVDASGEAAISVHLDALSVLKAARSISSELDIDRLRASLMRILMDASGAQYICILHQLMDGRFAYDGGQAADLSFRGPAFLNLEAGQVVPPECLPMSVLNLCVGLEAPVVIADARTDTRCMSDPFVMVAQPASLMCAPLLSRGKLLRVVYVQNDLVVGAFSKRRLVVFEGLSSQAAISIENSLLYKELQADKRRLEEARDEAVQANQAKSEFLATMSHEIRTPMNGILSTTTLLAQMPLNNEVKESVEIIQGAGEILLQLIESILDFSNLERGKVQLVKRPMSIARNIEQCIKLLEPVASQKGLQLTLEASEVPETVIGDAVRLRQIVINVVSNAIKFTEHGFVSVRYTGRTEGAGTEDARFELQIMVKDTGCGIDEQHLSKLFKSFSQVDSSPRRRKEGVGLGLVICQNLTQLMGGRVWVESIVGRGSTFYCTLRFALGTGKEKKEESTLKPAASLPSPALPDKVPERLTPTPAARHIRILIVDDNKINQKVLSKMLAKLGFSADVANNGLEAITRVEEAKPHYDVVLMDVFMPEMDGVEATGRIRAMREVVQPIIVAVTASAMAGDREKFIAAGMTDYIPKPVNIDLLTRCLQTAQDAKTSAP